MLKLSKSQVVLIAASLLLIVGLLALDIKMPNTSKAGEKAKTETTAAALDFNKLKSTALQSVPGDAKAKIQSLEIKAEKAEGAAKTEAILELADAYFAYKQFSVSGFYFLQEAENTKSIELFVKAGDAFRDAYRNNNDSTTTPLLVEKAKVAYQQALDIDSANLDAKTGLGTCFVDASENPMQGIQLLLEVVKKDPENINANLNLGMFSMRSGQYDKAIARFETVVKKKPSAESYAMLAEAHEQKGDKASAIKALTKAKEYVIDPQIIAGIDAYIKTLEK